jgi:DNA helicase HerA-like ATPase
MRSLIRPDPSLPLGTIGPWWHRRLLAPPLSAVLTHQHVIGASNSGKSRYLAGLLLALLARGVPVILIDPHGSLAELVLAHLVARGVYRRTEPDPYERLVYLDIPAAAAAGRFLPFNILRQAGTPYDIASNVKEAFHRAYSELATGAPMFDTLVQNSAKVLLTADLPITALFRFLTDRAFRDGLLAAEADVDIVAFFHDQYDRLSLRDQADQAGAALRRAQLLTFNPVLKYSLGQRHSALCFPEIFAAHRSVIINLKLGDDEARRLFGSLITIAAEHAALARVTDAGVPLTPFVLFLDEFHQFSAQSGQALADMLSQTRKFGLFLAMAHQDWTQTPTRLKGALSNVGLEAVFRLDRDDAEYTARKIGRVDPKSVRQAVSIEESQSAGMAEQWERWVQAIQDLKQREAFIRCGPGAATKVKTLSVPTPVVDPDQLAAVKEQYLTRYFRDQASVTAELERHRQADAPPPTQKRFRYFVPTEPVPLQE